MKVRKHIFFSGTVQGVGFRYRSYYIARSYDLTGWVKNLWDDRVEMEVQGEESDIEQLIAKLGEGRFLDISHIEKTDMPLVRDEREFQIKGY